VSEVVESDLLDALRVQPRRVAGRVHGAERVPAVVREQERVGPDAAQVDADAAAVRA
jgi:hypothetical protein